MPDLDRLAGRDAQQLVRERFIWRFRLAALVFVAVQTLIAPGDSSALSWGIVVFFAAGTAGTGWALRGAPDARRVTRVGVAGMASDAVVVAAVMANNQTDPAEPLYLIGILAMLEATIRWRRWGGVIAGLLAGVAAGTWTVVVAQRTVGETQLDYATMRAGVLAGLGVFLGGLVRRVTEQHDRLQGVLDTSRDLIVSVGSDGRIQSASAASLHILGWTPEEMVGRQYMDLIHPEDLVQTHTPVHVPAEHTMLFERRVACRDGSYRWLEMNVAGSPAGDLLHVSARDVTERREARRRIEESEQRFRSLFEHNTDAVYAVDLEGRYSMANPASETLTGYSTSELIGMPFADIVDPAVLADVAERFARASAGEPQSYETAIHHRHGERIELDVTNVPIIVDDEIVGVFGIAKDVTDRRRLERALGHQATHDALTGIPNRAHLESALAEAEVATGERILLFIDLDRFKLVNDSLGHRIGDEVLVVAVQRLLRHVRSGDLLARWAGDEFCVLLAEGTSPDTALTVADRLRSVLAEPFHVAGRELRLSASIGVAGSDGGDGERLVQVADHAMYEAKRAGRDRVQLYVPSAERPGPTQIDLELELRRAIDDRGLVLHYQPIVDTRTGAIVGVESLVRWPQPDGSLRPPMDFVPVAEESGLIRHLTGFVLEEVCAQLARWDRDLGTPRTLQAWVNVSISDLEAPHFAEEVAATAARAGVTPDRLVLEVTETMLMRDHVQVDRTVDALREAGVSIAIDDFGTGYSSMSQLHRFEVTACKIDRIFVAGAPERRRDAAILRALVEVGTAFGFPVVAEGIERVEELAMVQAIGCPLAQGFLLSEPCSAAALATVLHAGSVQLPRAVRSGR